MIAILNKYDRIRTILGVSDIDLTNEVIDYPEYSQIAENHIKNIVTNWQALTNEEKTIFESCILYKTAELLVAYCKSSIYNIQSEQTTHSKVSYFETNIQDKYTMIRDKLYEMLHLISNDFSDVFYGFTTTNI